MLSPRDFPIEFMKSNASLKVATPLPPCKQFASLWFHHAFKSPYLSHCIPFARYVTILREPLSQIFSWYAYILNAKYYARKNLTRECVSFLGHTLDFEHKFYRKEDLAKAWRRLSICKGEDEMRRNITIQLVAHKVRESLALGTLHNHGWNYLVENNATLLKDAQAMIAYMNQEYFLVGVSPRINEFLAVLALHMGWDLSRMYYLVCKPNYYSFSPKEFGNRFPHLFEQVKEKTQTAQQVYQYFSDAFSRNMDDMYIRVPELKETLRDYNSRLQEFQRQNDTSVEKWSNLRYYDGEEMIC